jgi:transposase
VPNGFAFRRIRRDRHTAACWAHGRRKFFDLARLSNAPMSVEVVRRIDALFVIEREINAPQEPVRASGA